MYCGEASHANKSPLKSKRNYVAKMALCALILKNFSPNKKILQDAQTHDTIHAKKFCVIVKIGERPSGR